MLNDSIDLGPAGERDRSSGAKILAGLCAIAITGALLTGYAYMRKRHAQQTLSSAASSLPASPEPKGPPKAQIIVDEPMLKGSETIIGGRVKNVSSETLSGLSVHLELRRRKDAQIAESWVSIEPSQLQPNEEGAYSVKFPAQDYSSVRLAGLTADPNSAEIAFVSSQGKQRPPERLEPKPIVISKQSSKKGGFLNSPDNPARVP